MSSESGNLSSLMMIPLLLICCLLPMIMQRGQRRQGPKETETWITIKNIREVYKDIKSESEAWREQVSSEPPRKNLFPFAKTDQMPTIRFEEVTSKSPRLLRLRDIKEGEILFELTEFQDKGTSIKVTYEAPAKARIQTLKSTFPIRILSQWESCPKCDKPILPDYKQCPYCGNKLKEDNR